LTKRAKLNLDHIYKSLLIASIFIGLAGNAFCQKYNFAVLNAENELDVPKISSMASGNNGYLYFGGKETIYRFDGKSAEALDRSYKLPFTEIKQIFEDKAGRILFISNNKLMQFGLEEPLIGEAVNTYLAFENLIFFGTNSGLKIYDREKNFIERTEALSQLESLEINDLLLNESNLYLASNEGLFLYDIASKTLEGYSNTEMYDLQKLTKGSSSNLWAYDGNGTLVRVDLNSKSVDPFYNRGFQFTDMTVDSIQRLWVGTTDKGLLLYDTGSDRWSTINRRSGLVDNRVSDIHVDLWGAVWISTADNSLSKYIDLDYQLYNVYDGLASDEVSSLFSFDDVLFFAAGTKGIFSYQNNQFKSVYELDVKSEALYIDSSEIWIGTNGDGLVQIKNGETSFLRKVNGIPSNWVSHIVKDKEGNIWIATSSNGIAKINHNDSLGFEIKQYGIKEGLKELNITALFAHSNGAIFYGSQSGKLGMIKNDNHSSITSAYLRSEISQIIEDQEGALYFSSLANGVSKLSLKKSFVEEKVAGYPQNIKAITIRNEELWAANDKGISNGRDSFFASDGFPSNKINKSEMVLHHNRIWIGSMDGLISLGKLVKNTIERKPKIYFESIQLGYDRSPIRGQNTSVPAILEYNQNQINFEYEGVDIHSNKDLSYSFILEGRDQDWSTWSKNDNLSLNNLSPGKYTFKVKARSSEESVSDALSFSFIAKGPLWKERWFIAVLILLSGLLIYLVFRQRLNAIRKKNAEEKSQLELKNKLLELEQKANQLQMNPHFIFNALNSIQATVAKEDYQDARREISDFATLMRSILSNSKERVIALTDELHLLEKYVEIERKCRSLDFDYKVEIDPKIDQDEVLIPPMIIQPFIENAIIHGLAKKKHGQLIMTLNLVEEGLLQVTILDNGIGFDTSKAQNKGSKHKSIAVEVTKERLEAMLDKKQLPGVHIQQVSAEGGTVVQLKIPIEYNF
jgi:sensor histidine kinase YesM/ligand-binding sensor domain-containing protein